MHAIKSYTLFSAEQFNSVHPLIQLIMEVYLIKSLEKYREESFDIFLKEFRIERFLKRNPARHLQEFLSEICDDNHGVFNLF